MPGGMTNTMTDYLDVDPKIPGQNYVVLSFLSPENVLVQKDTFVLHKYMNVLADELSRLFANLKKLYPDAENDISYVERNHAHFKDLDALHDDFTSWRRVHEIELDSDFKESSGETSTVRGVKIRGVFSSDAEVRKHVDRLRVLDKAHDIFVTEVGAWVPWDPSSVANGGKTAEYTEEKLNDLAKKHEERREAMKKRVDDERESIRDRIKHLGAEQEQTIESAKEVYGNMLAAATTSTAAEDDSVAAGPSQQ